VFDVQDLYLEEHFVPDFNKRFTVVPEQAEYAFTKLVGIDLRLLLSVQEERIVRDDNGMVTAVVRFDPRELEVWRAHRPDRRR